MSDLNNIPKQSNFETTLAVPIDSSQTTGITLSVDPDYTPSGETVRVTILNPKGVEHLTCTGWTANVLSGVTRGVAAYSGGASTARAHGAGTKVIIGNPWQLYSDIQTAINSKLDETDGVCTTPLQDAVYASEAALNAAIPTPANGRSAYCTLEGKAYDSIGGAWVARESGGTFANASTTNAGKVEESTLAEQGSQTAVGGTGARLFMSPSNTAKTSSGASDENKVPLLDSSGALASGFLPSSVQYKSTLTAKGDLYVATASGTVARQAVGSNDQVLVADSSQTNGIKWAAAPAHSSTSGIATRAGNTASGSQTIAHGLGRTPVKVRLTAKKLIDTKYIARSHGVYDGSGQCCVYDSDSSNADNVTVGNSTTRAIYVKDIVSATGSQEGAVSVDGTNITIAWTLTGTCTSANINILWEAE